MVEQQYSFAEICHRKRLRWDLRTNTALKLQYDRVTPHDGSRGTLINTLPDFRSGQSADVVSLAFDFVY